MLATYGVNTLIDPLDGSTLGIDPKPLRDDTSNRRRFWLHKIESHNRNAIRMLKDDWLIELYQVFITIPTACTVSNVGGATHVCDQPT
ncbi:hypothetical protein [Cerasicoccus frondis]|uniref:hypothetical protein n=1 Tax=Cerasicoccus frondis TaxID=490090 RepID=UPI002852D935|nr:hypothetical protein [Cerasicoccus frondis]